MDSNHFKSIMDSLHILTVGAKDWYDKYEAVPDLKEWKVKDINLGIHVARGIQSRMDAWLMTDLYHVIGMGNLSARQISMLVGETRELLKYRNVIKTLATQTELTVSYVEIVNEQKNYTLVTNNDISIMAAVKSAKLNRTKNV